MDDPNRSTRVRPATGPATAAGASSPRGTPGDHPAVRRWQAVQAEVDSLEAAGNYADALRTLDAELAIRTDDDWDAIIDHQAWQTWVASDTFKIASAYYEIVKEERAGREKVQRKLAGRPPTGDRAKAKAAYEKARREGEKVEAAILAAMEAGGFKSASRLYEIKKEDHWE